MICHMYGGLDRARILALLLLCSLLSAPVMAQEVEEEPEEDDDESTFEIESSDGAEGDSGIRIDPYPPAIPPEQAEPNQPHPVTIGVWNPPKLKPAQQKELDRLLARRAEQPENVAHSYRIADFYLAAKWLPQAEAEFLRCAKLDPQSIRPWDGVLRVYFAALPGKDDDLNNVIVGLGNIPAAQRRIILRDFGGGKRKEDWIPSDRERATRITRALRELVRRRPDDIPRRHQLLEHLRGQGRYGLASIEAREILKRLPEDVQTRYELAQALLQTWQLRVTAGETEEADRILAEVRALLEENVRRAPDHAASAIRLARIYEAQDGDKKSARIEELEKRAFLSLFLVPELGKAAFREDTFRMARDLAGPTMARDLWDEAVGKPARSVTGQNNFNQETVHVTRWLRIHFPHAHARERERAVRSLARRGDASAAVVILSFLWHIGDPAEYEATVSVERKLLETVERAAIEAVTGIGTPAFPAAQRYLKTADTSARRRRGVAALRGIGDKRAVGVLVDALAWDKDPRVGFGVSAALEELGDPLAIDALVGAADDEPRPLARRREAVEALAVFKDPRSVELVNSLAKDGAYARVCTYALFRLNGDTEALARLVAMAKSGDNPPELLRLAAKCDEPAAKAIFLALLRVRYDPAVRERTLRIVKERFWKDSRAQVTEIFLREAESPAVSAFVLRELGEIGGAEAASRLIKLLEGGKLSGEHWAVASRALARTGDERAVRHFSRLRILEKNPGKRKLAAQLYQEAAKRHAELKRAGR